MTASEIFSFFIALTPNKKILGGISQPSAAGSAFFEIDIILTEIHGLVNFFNNLFVKILRKIYRKNFQKTLYTSGKV
jgi:hypothetical protein